MKVEFKDNDERFNRYAWHEAYTSDPKEAKETATSRMKRLTDSIRDRGQTRERKSYSPPAEVREKIMAIFVALSSKNQLHCDDLAQKTEESIMATNLDQSMDFKSDMITQCIQKFGHDLSSAYLNDICTVADLVQYYSTPVQGVDSYTGLIDKADSLPTNLAMLADPVRFDKENDEFFKGQSALPGIISNVPGLRAQKKYKILNQDEFQWPDV